MRGSARLVGAMLVAAGVISASAQTGVTTLRTGNVPVRTDVRRMGINLSGQTYWDSGQMLRNLVFRNPGFEGERWQTILQCRSVAAGSCTDRNEYTVWPAGFLNGASYEVLSGKAKGAAGTVRTSTRAENGHGVQLALDRAPEGLGTDDFLLVKLGKPGGAETGWWPETRGGGRLATEFRDLSPQTPGRQALRMEARGAEAVAGVASYFDSMEGHSFVRLRGAYELRFRAKGICGEPSCPLAVRLERMDPARGLNVFFDRTIALQDRWQDFTFNVPTDEPPDAVGTAALSFRVQRSAALLDDVVLEPVARAPGNSTAFRDEVVAALRELRPGVLRFIDNGASFGASLDDLLADPYTRRRSGSSTQESVREDVAFGLPEFLTLCESVGAEPWISLPAGFSPEEMARLVEYLAGPVTSPWGMRRTATGHARPWAEVFPAIHLELGNEVWNYRSFAGAAIPEPAVYGRRAAEVFGAGRRSRWFRADRFDLVLGSWAANAWWTGQELDAAQAVDPAAVDSVAVAPYLLNDFQDASSEEAVFGPLFAEPELWDSRPAGLMAQQAAAATRRAHPVRLDVYETNLGTMTGSVDQHALDQTLPSLGAGLAVADHMLLMLRDTGAAAECFFALPEFRNGFDRTGGQKLQTALWGAVVDMGGATDRRRPQFLAVELVNRAILPIMLPVLQTGANPVWNQRRSANDGVELPGAHLLQSFAFSDGKLRRSMVLLNLSRTEALPARLDDPNAPTGPVSIRVFNADRITDGNEDAETVRIVANTIQLDPGRVWMLPAHSLTELEWEVRP